MEENNNLNLESSENESIKLSKDELKEKLILDFYYLKNQIENLIESNDNKQVKSVSKLLKSFEKSLENTLETKVSTKQKNLFIELKNSNFDTDVIKLSKFI